MLRHGRTETNERRVFAGASDISLSPSGAEALRARRALYPPAAFFFTSGMCRADETLALLYGDVPRVPIPALSEYDVGQFEGRTHDDLYAAEPLYRAWLAPDAIDLVCPGGESRRAFEIRVLSGWQTLVSHSWDGLAILIAHGGVLHTLMDCLCPRDLPHPTPDNGRGWRLTLDAAGTVSAWEAFE